MEYRTLGRTGLEVSRLGMGGLFVSSYGGDERQRAYDALHRALELGVNYGMTMTCYDPTPEGLSCGECDACSLRLKGFEANRIADPAPYVRARV